MNYIQYALFLKIIFISIYIFNFAIRFKNNRYRCRNTPYRRIRVYFTADNVLTTRYSFSSVSERGDFCQYIHTLIS